MKTLIILIILVYAFQFAQAKRPLIQISDGSLEGILAISRNGRQYSAFFGIPYAQPTERFEVSKKVIPWSGIKDASSYGSICTQFDPREGKVRGNEDCLSVNVFSPNISAKLPVLVFIHGGGFAFGYSEEAGAEYLMDEDIVFVTLNYRVGVDGFLSTGDEVIPGNFGLKDQLLGLNWIKENVWHFGGDKNSITIMGESAGAASVGLQLLSPLSKGLFHKVICVSGTALDEWSVSKNPMVATTDLANRLGCPTSDSLEIKQCLKNKSKYEVYSPDPNAPHFAALPFVPVVEKKLPGAFLTDSPEIMYERGEVSNVPLLVTANKDEGLLLFAIEFKNSSKLRDELNNNWYGMAPILFKYNELGYSQEQMDKISDEIKSFYFGDKLPASDESFQNLTNAFSDFMFIHGTREAALQHQKYASTYAGILSFKGIWSQIFFQGYTEFLGMTHADDLQYVFSHPWYPKFPPGSDVFMASRRLIKTFTNFAKSGDPSIDVTNWESVSDLENESRILNWMYMENTDQYSNSELLMERMKFWDNIHKIVVPTFRKIKTEL